MLLMSAVQSTVMFPRATTLVQRAKSSRSSAATQALDRPA
jgi:hypothetical protein